jgi:hypothetical protein
VESRNRPGLRLAPALRVSGKLQSPRTGSRNGGGGLWKRHARRSESANGGPGDGRTGDSAAAAATRFSRRPGVIRRFVRPPAANEAFDDEGRPGNPPRPGPQRLRGRSFRRPGLGTPARREKPLLGPPYATPPPSALMISSGRLSAEAISPQLANLAKLTSAAIRWPDRRRPPRDLRQG